jgi:hypothetical protein
MTDVRAKVKKKSPIKVPTGHLRLVKDHYHAVCPNGQVIACVIGWLGDQIGIDPENYYRGAIVPSYAGCDDNFDVRDEIKTRFDLDDGDLETLQVLNDDGDALALSKKLKELGVVDKRARLTIELVKPTEEYSPMERRQDD